mmetsp:Transcript_91261/g.258444  ORF Transcript_91261/g.258444 Transcript_91261/m.258444 type:complete len:223 (-) Transcript_91261:482-1150(-)
MAWAMASSAPRSSDTCAATLCTTACSTFTWATRTCILCITLREPKVPFAASASSSPGVAEPGAGLPSWPRMSPAVADAPWRPFAAAASSFAILFMDAVRDRYVSAMLTTMRVLAGIPTGFILSRGELAGDSDDVRGDGGLRGVPDSSGAEGAPGRGFLTGDRGDSDGARGDVGLCGTPANSGVDGALGGDLCGECSVTDGLPGGTAGRFMLICNGEDGVGGA